MAGCTNPQTVTVDPATASGANSVAVSAPNVQMYPRPPKRDDGKFQALGSVIGALIGRLANSGRLSAASNAEDTWRGLNDQLKDRGIANWGRSDADRTDALTLFGKDTARADNAVTLHDTDRAAGLALGSIIEDRSAILVVRADEEDALADRLRGCIDNLTDKLCNYASCGYKPDYDGILSRVKADTQIVQSEKIRAVRRRSNRYNTGLNADVECAIVREGVLATVGSAAKMREDERQFMWKYNGDLMASTLKQMEMYRTGRLQNELNMTREALDNYKNQERSRYTNAQFYEREASGSYQGQSRVRNQTSVAWDDQGAKETTSAGQNYAWMAESLRRTAQLDGGAFAALGAALGLFLPTFFNACAFSTPDNCGCVECTPGLSGKACEDAGGIPNLTDGTCTCP